MTATCQIVPPAIERCLDDGQGRGQGRRRTSACRRRLPRVADSVAKAAGIDDKAMRDRLHAICGDTGAAHRARAAGRRAGEGQARRQDPGRRLRPGRRRAAVRGDARDRQAGPSASACQGHLARRKEETNYGRFLAFNDLIDARARHARRRPTRARRCRRCGATARRSRASSAASARKCGTLQFPKTDICVNPNCNAIDTPGAARRSPTWPAESSPTRPTGSPTRPIRPPTTA